MKTKFSNYLLANIPALLAIGAFIIFSSLGNPEKEHNHDAALGPTANCCSGYNIQVQNLRKFMIDSLHGIQFEGGVYAKEDIRKAMNAVNGDSVYLLNSMVNCQLGQGTKLAFTCPTTTTVSFVSTASALCKPCPGKACCHQYACVARINRSCINYVPFTPSPLQVSSASKVSSVSK